ncbi:hypothetical protein BH24DEI1_BH24DEI1_09710 [soil metagenome]
MPEPTELRDHGPGWAESYELEKGRIVAALGDCTEGGVLEGIAHIGSTSISGMAAKPCIDIAARVHPLPMPGDRVQALTRLGYDDLGEYGIPGRHYFRKEAPDVHLHVVAFDTEHWPRYLLFRDFLRTHPEAATRYERLKFELAARFADDRQAYTDGKGPLIRELERAASLWHVRTTGFAPIEAVAGELAGLPCPWFVSSGWALDLFMGAPTRYHDDLDLGVFRDDVPALQGHLMARGWRLHKVVEDGKYAPWLRGEALEAEVTQVHARWGGEFLDILLTPRRGDRWLYRRDEGVSLPLARALLHRDALIYLAPEAVLLFKSATSGKPPRRKDEEDFARVLPRLSREQRAWLRAALARRQPEHSWLGRL